MRWIVRLEWENGEGPFSAPPYFRQVSEDIYLNLVAMPNPFMDGLRGKLTPNHHCAFKSISYIRKNILDTQKEEILKVAEAGFKFKKILVKNCHVGQHQVLFRRQDVIKEKEITHKFLS